MSDLCTYEKQSTLDYKDLSVIPRLQGRTKMQTMNRRHRGKQSTEGNMTFYVSKSTGQRLLLYVAQAKKITLS